MSLFIHNISSKHDRENTDREILETSSSDGSTPLS